VVRTRTRRMGLEPCSSRPSFSLTLSTHLHPHAHSLAPSTDNNEWYYPAPPRPSSELDEDELEEEENSLPAGLRKGNWGNKLVRGSRWVRRGKIVNWGPGKNEWEVRPFGSRSE
jgi:hypothetical protein